MMIKVHIQPGAKKNEIVGPYGDAIKIRLKAPPVDGKANDALIEFLAEKLDVPKANITIKSGHTSRTKFIEVNCTEEKMKKLL